MQSRHQIPLYFGISSTDFLQISATEDCSFGCFTQILEWVEKELGEMQKNGVMEKGLQEN